jgi:S-adenosylmethionine decarboxylase
MKSLGNHLIVELYDCDKTLINNVDFVENTLVEASIKAKATIIEKKFHRFSPHGVSGAVIIAESHFAIHTWPEYGYCAVDIFTCGNLTDNPAALEHIKEAFKSGYYSATEMKRGILNIPEDQIKHKPDDK